jgi:hypothetical protein
MSLVRTALRLVVIESLRDATVLGKRIYDSRMDDLSPDDFKGDEAPIAIVMTDKDEGDALSAQNGGPPFGREIELSIEIGVTQRVRSPAEEGADPEFLIIYPNTDARLEALLDMIEFQVMRRLQYVDEPAPTLFRRFWRIRKYDCHRQIMDEAGVKIACRVLTLNCYSGDDRILIYNACGTQPAGYDVLPDPLASVCKLMPAGSDGKATCDMLAAAVDALTLPQFGGMDNVVDAGNNVQGDVPSTEVQTKVDVETVSPIP